MLDSVPVFTLEGIELTVDQMNRKEDCMLPYE